MRKVIIFVALLFPLFVSAQDEALKAEVSGALGLSFGISKDSAAVVLATAKNIEPYKKTDKQLFYTNVIFGGSKYKFVFLYFTDDNRLYKIHIVDQKKISEIVQSFGMVKNDLKKKYGAPSVDYEDYSRPNPNQIQKELDIYTNKAFVLSVWGFGKKTGHEWERQIVITIGKVDGMDVLLDIEYIDNSIGVSAIKAKEGARLSDY